MSSTMCCVLSNDCPMVDRKLRRSNIAVRMVSLVGSQSESNYRFRWYWRQISIEANIWGKIQLEVSGVL